MAIVALRADAGLGCVSICIWPETTAISTAEEVEVHLPSKHERPRQLLTMRVPCKAALTDREQWRIWNQSG